jgi:hypothetical protein
MGDIHIDGMEVTYNLCDIYTTNSTLHKRLPTRALI